MTSPGLEEDRMIRASSASGFWVGWALQPSSSFKRSEPEQIGNNQSERIWTSSLAAFIAS